MPRVKRGVMTHKRHKNVIARAKGYFGLKKNVYQVANEAVRKSGNYAYRDRRNKKRDIRRLWITRINAACRNEGTRYSVFIAALNKHSIALDRKVLSAMAIEDPAGFRSLVEHIGLGGKPVEPHQATTQPISPAQRAANRADTNNATVPAAA